MSSNPRNTNAVDLRIVPGGNAPRYIGTKQLSLKFVALTEQGTTAGLPILDFVMEDDSGQQYLLVMTGRIANAISAAVRGTNLRIHGQEEP
jgi:hypothetical protein